MPKLEDIQIRSEEVSDILGRPPRGLVRWGITVIFLIITTLLVGSMFFKYPEIILAKATIVTENPPIELKSFATGKITQLFAAEGQNIAKNKVIAIVENTANYDDIQTLQSILDTLSSPNNFPNLPLNLGELQQIYASFQKTLLSYQNFLIIDEHNTKIKYAETSIRELQSYLLAQKKQLDYMSKELQFGEKQFDRDKKLFEKEITAPAEYEKAEQNFLAQQRAFENQKSLLTNTQMQITQYKTQISELFLDRTQQESDFQLQIHENYANLTSQLETWKKTYLITTPIDGKITFTDVWKENQSVTAGQLVATVIPNAETKIIGKLLVPTAGAGKIKTGQTVNIKLDNFPYMEFGMLKARITNLSLVPIQSEQNIFYYADIEFNMVKNKATSLISTYNKKIQFTQQMNGTAEIITDDLTLFERLLNPIRALWKR